MLIKERLALLKAGYTRDEINEMISEEKAISEAPEESKPAEQQADSFLSAVTALAEEVKNVKKAIQLNNLNNVSIEKENTEDSVDKILASLINPTTPKEEE